MKKRTSILIAAVLAIVMTASYFQTNWAFLSAAVAVDAGATKTNGAEFTSQGADKDLNWVQLALLTVTFTRAAGSASKVYFEFQISYDGGTTYTTAYYWRVEVATNETAVSDVVRYSELIPLYGVSHIRLYRIVNDDSGNNLTDCNAYISY